MVRVPKTYEDLEGTAVGHKTAAGSITGFWNPSVSCRYTYSSA
jgi:hypothetical protein